MHVWLKIGAFFFQILFTFNNQKVGLNLWLLKNLQRVWNQSKKMYSGFETYYLVAKINSKLLIIFLSVVQLLPPSERFSTLCKFYSIYQFGFLAPSNHEPHNRANLQRVLLKSFFCKNWAINSRKAQHFLLATVRSASDQLFLIMGTLLII